MKSYIITIKGNEISEHAAQRCKQSTDLEIETFDAVTSDQAESELSLNGLSWTYPWDHVKLDFKSGLSLVPYTTKNRNNRIACFLSHYKLWEKCIDEGPLLILEHDAIFIQKFKYQYLLDSIYGIISINDPRGATRMSARYHEVIQKCNEDIAPVPMIDDMTVAQGLPGNSAYIIKPTHASKMIDLVNDHGAWPNDAIMCKQLIPLLGASKSYYTKVQGTQSTTTL